MLCIGLLFASVCLRSVAALADAPVDPVLEQALDEYLRLGDRDANHGEQFLLKLEQQHLSSSAPGSRARLINYLVYLHLANDNAVRARELNDQLKELARTHEYPDLHVLALVGQLNLLPEQHDLIEAFKLTEQLAHYAAHVKSGRVRYVGYYTSGGVLLRSGEFEQALSHFQAALAAVANDEIWRNELRRVKLKAQITRLHRLLNNWPLTISMADEAIDDANRYQQWMRIPELLALKGQALTELGNHDAAAKAFDQGLEKAAALNYPEVAADLWARKAELAIRQRHYDSAKAYLDKALALASNHNLDETEWRFLRGYLHGLLGLHAVGIREMEQSISVLEQRNELVLVHQLLWRLAEIHRIADQPKNEAQVLRRRMALAETLFNAQRDRQVSELEAKFSVAEKLQQIERLKAENEVVESQLELKALQQQMFLLLVLAASLAVTLLLVLYHKIRRMNVRLQQSNQQLTFQSTHDALTGLLNRRSFQEYMESRVQQPTRRQNAVSELDGIIMLDVDWFKQVNDQHGHTVGDAVLKEVALRLDRCSREGDMVMRWGGEEFLMLVRSIDFTSLTGLVGRILHTVACEPIRIKNLTLTITVSAGYLNYPFSGLPSETLSWEKAIDLADLALYVSKTRGRNRAHGFDHVTTDYESISSLLESNINEAMDRHLLKAVMVMGPHPDAANNDQ